MPCSLLRSDSEGFVPCFAAVKQHGGWVVGRKSGSELSVWFSVWYKQYALLPTFAKGKKKKNCGGEGTLPPVQNVDVASADFTD